MEKIIAMATLLLLLNTAAAATASSLIPTASELSSLGVQNANMYNKIDRDDVGFARHYFSGKYGDAGVAIIIGVTEASNVPEPGNLRESYSCKTNTAGFVCYQHGKPNYDGRKYKHGAAFWGAKKAGNYAINVRVIGDYNTTDPTVLGPKILQLTASKIMNGPTPTLTVAKPRDGQKIVARNDRAVITVEATAENADYVGAHYESSRPKPTMIGGEMTKSGSKYAETIVVSGGDLAYGDAIIRVYAKNDSGGEVEVIRHVKIVQESKAQQKDNGDADVQIPIKKDDVKNAVQTVKNAVPDVAGNPLDFQGVGHIGGALSESAKARATRTKMRISMVAQNNGTSVSTVKTPEGERPLIHAESSKGKGVSWFKAKYYGNKAASKIIDGVANYLPAPVKAITGYVKDSVQDATMNNDEKAKATAKDLGVDEMSASNYNRMNNIDDREKKLNTIKNTLPLPGTTKPFDFILNQMGVSFKKIVASDYGWEYREAMKRAMGYRKGGMKYRDVIKNTIRDMEEMYGTDHRTYLLDRNSKDGFKDQESRVRVYLEQLFEERKI